MEHFEVLAGVLADLAEENVRTRRASAAAERAPSPVPPSPSTAPLFEGLVVSNPPPRRSRIGIRVSAAVHVVGIVALVTLPVLWPMASPEHPDYIRALIYDPPPPPPPPLPKGSALMQRAERPKPVTPDPEPEKPKTSDLQVPVEEPLKREARASATEQAGSPSGSDLGVPEGMEGGVEGGVVGGVLGGVLGGVVGGTGDIPIFDYDQPPRPIKLTKPVYPQEAFVKKIEGTVVVEIVIDVTGRVIRARVIQSIPLLDAAALQTVYQWVFAPALKHGRPVMTVAQAPVGFRIY